MLRANISNRLSAAEYAFVKSVAVSCRALRKSSEGKAKGLFCLTIFKIC